MQIEWQIVPLKNMQADAAVFFAFEKAEEHLPGLRRFLDEKATWLTGSAALKDFQAKPGSVAVFYSPPGDSLPRVILAGLGPAAQFDGEKLRNAVAFALRKCRELEVAHPAITLSSLEGLAMDAPEALREVLVGAITGLHRFDEMKTKNSESSCPETLVLVSEGDPEPVSLDVVSLAQAEAVGITLARDLTVAPANRVTPAFLVNVARELAERFGFELEIIDLEAARALGMGAFAAVAQGSREPAYVIVIKHTPAGTENDAPLVFAGKGITFDTGGISLKSSDKMDAMKQDMAGAASVLGAFEVIGRTGLKRRVIGILPCTENMPGGQAYKPGDVIRTYSGQTIEIISTDAEGRVVLCDMVAYAARQFAPAAMIDIATLTGACIVALGNQVAAVMGNRDELVRSIQQIGERVGERFWPLPLWDFYFESIKSDVADMKNVGARSAGAIIGGMFLKQFVPREIPWAHLDIAGTAWSDKDSGAVPRGATGFGVRTLFEIARKWPQLGMDPPASSTVAPQQATGSD